MVQTSLTHQKTLSYTVSCYTLPQRLNAPVCFCFSWKSVADYIDQQFEQYFRDESGLNRKNIQDNRVHCCLYFISPFGHGYDKAAANLACSSSLYYYF